MLGVWPAGALDSHPLEELDLDAVMQRLKGWSFKKTQHIFFVCFLSAVHGGSMVPFGMGFALQRFETFHGGEKRATIPRGTQMEISQRMDPTIKKFMQIWDMEWPRTLNLLATKTEITWNQFELTRSKPYVTQTLAHPPPILFVLTLFWICTNNLNQKTGLQVLPVCCCRTKRRNYSAVKGGLARK